MKCSYCGNRNVPGPTVFCHRCVDRFGAVDDPEHGPIVEEPAVRLVHAIRIEKPRSDLWLFQDDDELWHSYTGRNHGATRRIQDALRDAGVDLDTVPDEIRALPAWMAPRPPPGCCVHCFDNYGETVAVEQFTTDPSGRALYHCPECKEPHWGAASPGGTG